MHDKFQQTTCGRAGVEPATSGSAVRLAVDARDSAARFTWAAAWQSQQNGHCVQRRHRSACASAQSDQSLRCPHEQTLGPQLPIERTTKTLIRLGGCRCWSESSLGTKGIPLVLSWGISHSESASLSSLVPSEINHIFWRPCSLALWLQSQGSLVRAPALPHTGYTCNLHRISHEILYMVFLLFPLIQERQFLVISESIICTLDHFVLVNCLEGLSLSARRSGFGRSFNSSPGFIDRESANQIYWYMRGIVVTLSRSLHKFRWCWGGAISSSHTNLPTLIHALQYRTEWNLNIIWLHVAETNSGQFWGMKWCIPGMYLNARSPVLEASHAHYMTEILSQRFAR